MKAWLLVLAASLASPAWGDARQDAIQKVHAGFKDAVVVVTCQLHATDDPASPVQPQRIPGVLVDKKGLVMVSAMAFPDQVPLARYENFRVVTTLGTEDDGYPAHFLGKGQSPYLAFLRVAQPERLPSEMPALAFEEAEVPLGQELIMLAPTDQRDKRTFALGTCNLEYESPAHGWGVTFVATFGCPALTLEGKAVGIVAGRRIAPQQVQAFVLGAKDILPAVEHPPTAPDLPAASKPRGWTGLLYVQAVDGKDLAEDFGLPPLSGGMIVGNLIEDSPAGAAGLRIGDVILSFQGVDLKRNDRAQASFLEKIQRLGVDEKVLMEVWREGKRIPLEMLTTRLPKTATQAKREVLTAYGFVVREMVLDDRYNQRLPKEESGVICDTVNAATLAADAKLLPNDVIKKVNDREVEGLDAFKDAFQKIGEERPAVVYFTVLRGGKTTLTLRMEPRW